jgi:hypothetical protein
VTTPPRKFSLAESRQRVRHPLERLRGAIRTYVSLEGLAVLLIYLALWFWIGLALDYGFFKLFTVDWVQQLTAMGPAGSVLRTTFLVVLVAGLLAVVTVKVLLRLLREFRDSALALVLERRFPKILGDRLITAVELADPRLAQKYGFSQEMIDHTILDAAERVDQVPVQEVFNWKRLTNYGLVVAGLTVGLFVLVAVISCVAAGASVGTFLHRFGDVAAIWFERNILLANTIWPRKAHLELVDFPESGELRVGRNVASAPLKVRAVKWVVADPHAPDGWRSLSWSDLKAPLVPFVVPELPANWLKQRAAWTVDQVEQEFNKGEARQALSADARMKLDHFFDELAQLAAEPRMSRKLRRLEIPEVVMVYFRGEKTRSDMTLQRGEHNEFSGVYSDLTESVRFTATGEDYSTPYKQITVVPPPSLIRLVRNEYEPAYIYYRAPVGGTLADLKGLTQQRLNVPFSLSGPSSSVSLPAGSDVELIAESDKPLQDNVRILPREGKDGSRVVPPALAKAKVTLDRDGVTFRTRFSNLSGKLDFDFEFTDTDNVVGRRQVVITALEDEPPKVEVEVEVIRKTNQGYMITPVAKVPFRGTVSDDRGLEKIEYAYTLKKLESAAAVKLNAAMVVQGLHFLPGGASNPNLFVAPGYLRLVGRLLERASADEDLDPHFVPMGTFAERLDRLRKIPSENLALEDLKAHLRKDPTKRFLPLRNHDIISDGFIGEGFDLTKVPHLTMLKPVESKETQPNYQLRLWVTATDNDVENPKGPHVGSTRERFTFIIVSEAELLAEIFKEEENLHIKLESMVNDLKQAKQHLEELTLRLKQGSTAEQMSGPMALRAQEIEDSITKGSDITREVHFDYTRILKELVCNRVSSNNKIEQVDDTIVKPLDGALNGEFLRALDAQKALLETLKAAKSDLKAAQLADQRLDELIERLNKVLEAMADITTFQKVVGTIQKIERDQRQIADALKKIKDEMERIILEGLK